MNENNPRVILALANEANDEFAWNQLRAIQSEMFSLGPVAIKFAYFGAEGALETRRPYIATRWVADADAMADIMDRARGRCVCGCFVQVGDILDQALQETRQAHVRAVIVVGDRFHGDLDSAMATARKLRAAGTRLFVFQQGDRRLDEKFKALADETGGACFHFNPHVERVAKRLPGLLEGITRFALGGVTALEALEAQGDEPATLLLEQIGRK